MSCRGRVTGLVKGSVSGRGRGLERTRAGHDQGLVAVEAARIWFCVASPLRHNVRAAPSIARSETPHDPFRSSMRLWTVSPRHVRLRPARSQTRSRAFQSPRRLFEQKGRREHGGGSGQRGVSQHAMLCYAMVQHTETGRRERATAHGDGEIAEAHGDGYKREKEREKERENEREREQ